MSKIIWSESKFNYNSINIFYRYYIPSIDNNIALVFLHGRYTHSEYFDLIVKPDNMFALFSFDYPGQGRSSGLRGCCDTYKELPLLLEYFINEFVIPRYSKYYIIGESLGANLAIYGISYMGLKPEGIILLPGNFEIKLLWRIGKGFYSILNYFFPDYCFESNKSFKKYSQEEKILSRLSSDNFYCRKASIRYTLGILKLIYYTKKNANNIKVPILIFKGKNDHYSSDSAVHSFMKRVPSSTHCKIIYLENSKHWIAIGPDRGTIKTEIYDWIISIKGNHNGIN